MAGTEYKKQHKKISKKKAKRKLALAKKELIRNKAKALKWETLSDLSRDAIGLINNYVNYGKSLGEKYPEKLKDPVCKEIYGGYFKLLEEHLVQINRLIRLHAVEDKDGNPKVREDGSYIMRTGYCKDSDDDMTKILTLIDQYMGEIELLETMPAKIMLELAAQFESDNKIKEEIEDIKSKFNLDDKYLKNLKEETDQYRIKEDDNGGNKEDN